MEFVVKVFIVLSLLYCPVSCDRCRIIIERMEPKRIHPTGPCSMMEDYECNDPPKVKTLLLLATERLSFPASELLLPESHSRVKDPLNLVSGETFFKVTERSQDQEL
uniref:Uncharacterized protein LOC100376974 n=1 Tax=Saccoglossus kowalevskii TaxID=10224 RepID=A0ABM0GRY3_SACKO|nr:PREDICTED: uncharacterized protein LOC100376974 [Saccoglossus kowalevskii]